MTTATANPSTANAGSKRRLRIWAMCITLFLCWAAYTFIGQIKDARATQAQLTEIKKQVDDSTLQSKQLQQQIDRLNDPEYIRQLATKEQGMVTPGEQQIQVIK
ncbi:septum formation initiator family protein [Paenibacillus sp. ATY16]|uniref:FtsB family cell division protein n=1 Tax=Paenibacillus sp. ATY16 TaxID=1759312 RepID=UPI00200F4A83|nr:septum formation initiator family protein [Paenibacillus sp. ATY16]MCK9859235.1 septum formation initiator family protein [Paenibacillus sp. ATY16]